MEVQDRIRVVLREDAERQQVLAEALANRGAALIGRVHHHDETILIDSMQSHKWVEHEEPWFGTPYGAAQAQLITLAIDSTKPERSGPITVRTIGACMAGKSARRHRTRKKTERPATLRSRASLLLGEI